MDFFEEFPFLLHKLTLILTAFAYKPPWKMGKNIQAPAYYGGHTISKI